LYGLGDRNITFTWKHYGGVWKHGGKYAGLINELLDGYRKTRNPMRRKQLEKYMEFVPCHSCSGSRLNPQARSVRITSRSFSPQPAESASDRSPALPAVSFNLAEVCSLSIAEAARFFEELELDDTGRLIAEEVL